MSSYTKDYDRIVQAIVTAAMIFPPFAEGDIPSCKFYTENAAWDTGAEITIISPKVAKALSLSSIGKANVMGIGGDDTADVYKITLALPETKLYRDFFVYCADMDYELLIGMDIISQLDFCITNANNKTTLTFRHPPRERIDFTKNND